MGRVLPMAPEDIPEVADLHEWVRYGRRRASSQAKRDFWEEILFKNPWYDDSLPSLVYQGDDGRIAGFYALELLGPDDVELEALFVEPEMIGRGFGRTLIEHAKARASTLGIRQMVIQGEPNAQAFYEAAGGVCDGRRESSSISGRFLRIFRIDL